MEEVRLRWETAEVENSRLSVGLDGTVNSAWRESFEVTVRLLSRGDWGEVAVKKHKVRVADVPEGSEERLRHFLESAVEQANASQRPAERAPEKLTDDSEPDESPDAVMTERFQAFGSGRQGKRSEHSEG